MIIKTTKLPDGWIRTIYINNYNMKYEMTIQLDDELDAMKMMIEYVNRFEYLKGSE